MSGVLRSVACGVAAVGLAVALAVPAAAQAAQPETFTCPDVAGYEPTFTLEVDVSFNSFAASYSVNCWYQSLAADEGGATAQSELIVEGFWVPPDGDENVANFSPQGTGATSITYCSDVDEFSSGVGVTASGDRAIRATYKFREAQKEYDPELGKATALAVRAAVASFARSCDGVEIIPRSAYFTPLPPYLADALAAVEGQTLTGDSAGPAPASPTTAPATSAPTSAPATTVAVAAPSPAEPADGVGDWNGNRIVGAALLVLSAAGLAWTLAKARKERRIRPRLDLIRLVIVTASAVGMMIVLANTPPWAVAAAIAAGLVLGWLQGRNVRVRLAGLRAYERRSAIAVAAFAVGVVLAQGAGLLNRTGVIGVGVGVTFLSAALTAGAIAGRRRPLAAARGGATAVLLIGSALLVAALPFAGRAGAQESAGDDAVRAALLDDLTAAVAWDQIDVLGGLFVGDRKPVTPISIPPRLTEVPDDVTQTVEWTVIPPQFDEATQSWVDADPSLWQSFSVTETYSFGLSPDGICCTVGYDGTGTKAIGDAEPSVTTAAGTLGDFTDIAKRAYVSFYEEGRQEWGLPFGEVERIPTTTDDMLCRRPVVEQQRTDYDDWQTTFNGEDGGGFPGPGFAMYTGCDVAGFDVDSAQEVLPPAPPASAPERDVLYGSTTGTGCPVFQESFNALYDGSMGGAPVDQVRRLFLNPNSSACSAPITIGEEGPGGVRSEVKYALSTPDPEIEARRRYEVAENLMTRLRAPYELESLCTFDERGVPQPPAGDGETCELLTFHQRGDGVITIYTDYASFDGPNVTVRGMFPWGNYDYRCHHCDASSPEVARIVAAMEVFGNTGLGNFGEHAEVVGSVGAPDDRVGDTEGVVDIVDQDLIDLITDDPYEAAVLAGLIAMAGTIGLAGVAVAEDRLDRKEGTAEDGAPGRDDRVVVDEYGNRLEPNEDGLYPWDVDGEDTRWVDRDELDRLIGEAEAVRDEREREIAQRVAAGKEFGEKDLERLHKDSEAEAAAEAAAMESAAAHREKVWDWFQAHPEYDHLWERVIRPDGSVDTDLLNRIVTHAQQAGIEPPEITFMEDFVTSTVAEIFTGREADGSISWESMILRGILGAVSGFQTEWVYTPADAVVRMKAAIDAGDQRDWEEIAVETGAWAIFDEVFGRVIGKGLEKGAAGLAKLFPGLTRDATEMLETVLDRLRRPVVPRSVTPELNVFKSQIDEVLEAIARKERGAEQAARELFADHGMTRMAQLEAAGHLTAEQTAAIVKLHDKITREAIERGTRDAIAEWSEDMPAIREVYVGNSGSRGPNRSVKTDADRTIVLVFDDDQLAAFADARGMSLDDAHKMLQSQFSDQQAQRAAAALNQGGGVRLDAVEDMDMANYSGLGTGSGQLDSYPTQYTRSRMSVMGEADVYRVGESGVSRTTTSGDALLDQAALNQQRLTGSMPDAQVRIPEGEMTLLHNQQMTAIRNSTDIKTVAKAVDREVKVASMLDQPMPNDRLVQMAREIKASPTSTNAILRSYGLSEGEAVDALRRMMIDYDAGVRLPPPPYGGA